MFSLLCGAWRTLPNSGSGAVATQEVRTMRYIKLALAAGASIGVAAKLSPAHALPPVGQLDLNGPIGQGTMCIAPYGDPSDTPYGGGRYYDTGPGYNFFYECAPRRVAH